MQRSSSLIRYDSSFWGFLHIKRESLNIKNYSLYLFQSHQWNLQSRTVSGFLIMTRNCTTSCLQCRCFLLTRSTLDSVVHSIYPLCWVQLPRCGQVNCRMPLWAETLCQHSWCSQLQWTQHSVQLSSADKIIESSFVKRNLSSSASATPLQWSDTPWTRTCCSKPHHT